MKAVVTGAAGFIGSALCKELLSRDYEVTGLDRLSLTDGPRLQVAWDELCEQPRFTPRIADVVYDELDFSGADVVFHLAGLANTGESWDEVEAYMSVNGAGTARVCEACLEADVKLVHVSSSSVYGAAMRAVERYRMHPLSPYGVSKLAGETIVRAYQDERALKAIVIRPFSVYGPNQRPDMGIYKLIDATLRNTAFPLHGAGMQLRSHIYVDDLVTGIIQASQRAPAGRTFNLAGAEMHTMRQVIELVKDITGLACRLLPVPDPPGNQATSVADTSSAHRYFDFHPRTPLGIGLTRQIDWQKGQLWSLTTNTC